MNIQLQTGNTITMSYYEYLFILKDEDMDDFYQSCVADNLGIYIDNPWSGKASTGRLEYEDVPEIDEAEI